MADPYQRPREPISPVYPHLYELTNPYAPIPVPPPPPLLTSGKKIKKWLVLLVVLLAASVVLGSAAYALTGKYAGMLFPLTSVDWMNFTYTSSCYYRDEQFVVHNGSGVGSLHPDVQLSIIPPVTYGDLTGDGILEAVILYRCADADGEGPFAFVYSGSANYPVLISDLALQSGNDGEIQKASIVNNILYLSGDGYAASDPHCCPSLFITTAFRWNGSRFVVLSSSRIPLTPTPQ